MTKKEEDYSSREFYRYKNSIREIFKLEKRAQQPIEKHQDLLKQNLELVRLRNEEAKKETVAAPAKKGERTLPQKIKDTVKHAIHETIEGTRKCIQDYKFTKKLIFNKHIQDQ